jgi:hypothetical protein
MMNERISMVDFFAREVSDLKTVNQAISKTLAKNTKKISRMNRSIIFLFMVAGVTASVVCDQKNEIDNLKHRIDILEKNSAYSTYYDDEK